jgi:hypothetical protein
MERYGHCGGYSTVSFGRIDAVFASKPQRYVSLHCINMRISLYQMAH